MDQNRKEYLMQASPFEALFARLAQSDFRSRFRLGPEEVACIERRGMAVIRRHAEDFVRRRLADAYAGAPRFHRSACHSLLLPRLSGQVACDPCRSGADRTGTAICRGGLDGMDRTAVGAVSGDVRRDRRGGRPLPLFSEVPLRRLRGDVPNLRAGEAGAPALRRK